MLQKGKKVVVETIDWFLYKAISTKQKERLSKILTDKQKERLKSIIKPGKKRAQVRVIERVKYRLYNLGFIERGLHELQELFKNEEQPYLRKLAGWELATWHANQYSKDDARLCLHYITEVTETEKDKDLLRRATILKAECYNLLQENEKGKQMLEEVRVLGEHTDLYLAAANLEKSLSKRLDYINQAFQLHGTSPIVVEETDGQTRYDSIQAKHNNETTQEEQRAKVTIIIPAYNAENIIHTSIQSVLAQSWRNLEVFVVDDCSTDSTAAIVSEYEKKDNRVKLIQPSVNGGAYVARNHALTVATGDFVTINDADDWSHPEKIETQVKHLIENPKIIGNFSQQVRATNDLVFYRRGKPGIFMFANMSSFMFRRKQVTDAIGFWDSVRFGADSEYVKRIKAIFGEKSVVELQTAPLSFQRQSDTSLTSHSAFGFPGYFMGARKEYKEAQEDFHKRYKDKLYYEFPMKERPFPAPEPMWPTREAKPSGYRHFDVIIVSEFRLLGGTNMSNIEEIKAQKSLGMRTGLIQMSRYDLNSVELLNPKVRELLDGDQVQLLVYGENVSCDVLIVRHPPILQETQLYIPNVKAKTVQVIINQPPKRDYSDEGETLYHLDDCAKRVEQYFGQKGQWYPIGPLIRKTLVEHHQEELEEIQLENEDWVNIINIDEWKRKSHQFQQGKIRIGRHSRDQYVKWPNEKAELLSVYPSSALFEVRVLGGAKAPKQVIGELPSNWKVFEFGELDPKEFLAELDVFVYYTHPDWVEAFGRVIFEAMAAGVPVIIPPSYEPLFGEAAVYANPVEVQGKVKQLVEDENVYREQVEKASRYVEEQFGYSRHASRLERVLSGRNSK